MLGELFGIISGLLLIIIIVSYYTDFCYFYNYIYEKLNHRSRILKYIIYLIPILCFIGISILLQLTGITKLITEYIKGKTYIENEHTYVYISLLYLAICVLPFYFIIKIIYGKHYKDYRKMMQDKEEDVFLAQQAQQSEENKKQLYKYEEDEEDEEE